LVQCCVEGDGSMLDQNDGYFVWAQNYLCAITKLAQTKHWRYNKNYEKKQIHLAIFNI
jgi:hypothetical protein